MIPKLKNIAFFLLLAALPAFSQTVSPFMGLGNAQFFDNNGKPLTTGVLYSYQAGTTTQQATYTDSTGLILNPNPIPFGSGARVGLWLTSGAYYKFVLCAQNDGPSCAPADVLFSVDQVPGNPLAVNTGNTFTGTFISGSSTPATTGILRLATTDQICWRNQANTTNLCIYKDTADVLGWQGNAIKFTEGGCTLAGLGLDYLCANAAAHRWYMANNGGSQQQIVAAGVDINTSDQVTQLHFGSSAAPLSGTLPSSGQNLQWNGTQIVGVAQSPAITSYTRTNLVGSISVAVSTTTTVVSQSVTMPASGCPCRIHVDYQLYLFSTGLQSGHVNGGITDGTRTWAVGQTATTGGFNFGITAGGYSPTTYANNANVTITLQTRSDATAYTVNSSAQALSGTTGMDIVVFSSN